MKRTVTLDCQRRTSNPRGEHKQQGRDRNDCADKKMDKIWDLQVDERLRLKVVQLLRAESMEFGWGERKFVKLEAE